MELLTGSEMPASLSSRRVIKNTASHILTYAKISIFGTVRSTGATCRNAPAVRREISSRAGNWACANNSPARQLSNHSGGVMGSPCWLGKVAITDLCNLFPPKSFSSAKFPQVPVSNESGGRSPGSPMAPVDSTRLWDFMVAGRTGRVQLVVLAIKEYISCTWRTLACSKFPRCSTSSEKVGLCLGSPCQQSSIVWYLKGQSPLKYQHKENSICWLLKHLLLLRGKCGQLKEQFLTFLVLYSLVPSFSFLLSVFCKIPHQFSLQGMATRLKWQQW